MINKRQILFLVLLILVTPLLANAQLVPCDDNCTFQDFNTLATNIINFLLFVIAIPLATIMIIWGGVLLVLYPANPGYKDRAKKIIYTAIIGLFLALAAYLIVKTIIDIFVNPSSEVGPSIINVVS